MNLEDWQAHGKPLNSVVCCDCIDGMKQMADNSVDLVVTSPPYNLGNNHHTGNIHHTPYSDNIPELEYQEQQILILNELWRVTKDSGSLFYNHKNRIINGITITPYQWILKSNWIIKQELVWFNRSQNFDKIRFYPMTERIYWLVKNNNTILYNKINHHDVFKWDAVGTNTAHTRSFPIKMVKDIISCFKDSKIILDPFMGSGTTAVACKMTGRNFIGFEISEEYCTIANKRLASTQGMAEGLKRWSTSTKNTKEED